MALLSKAVDSGGEKPGLEEASLAGSWPPCFTPYGRTTLDK